MVSVAQIGAAIDPEVVLMICSFCGGLGVAGLAINHIRGREKIRFRERKYTTNLRSLRSKEITFVVYIF